MINVFQENTICFWRKKHKIFFFSKTHKKKRWVDTESIDALLESTPESSYPPSEEEVEHELSVWNLQNFREISINKNERDKQVGSSFAEKQIS